MDRIGLHKNQSIRRYSGDKAMAHSSNLRALFVVVMLFILIQFQPPITARAGGIYYIAPNGSNNNAGSINTPWLTLEYAAQRAGPGDTVYVRAGIYYPQSSIQLNSINSPEAPILFSAFPGEIAVIDGSRTANVSDVFTVRGQYYEIHGFEIRKARRSGINLFTGSHIRVTGNTIYDSDRDAVNGGEDTAYLYVDSNIIYHNCRRNDTFQFNHEGGWPSAVKTTERGDVISNNLIYENWGEGIGSFGEAHIIKNNSLHDNYSVEIYADNLADSIIDSNFIYTTNNPSFFKTNSSGVSLSASGISISNESASDPIQIDRLQVTNNIITGRRSVGLGHWKGSGPAGLKNSLIANNTVVVDGNSGAFQLDSRSHENTVIANNLFYQLNNEKSVAYLHNISGIEFHNNHWFGGSGIFWTGGFSGAGVGDLYSAPLLTRTQGNTPADFRLMLNSPAIDAGAFITGISRDFFGELRLAPFDIGAHETSNSTHMIYFLSIIKGR
jgi:hypothetical protein